jgi:hypothetical protein
MNLKEQYTELALAILPDIPTDAWFGDPLISHKEIVALAKSKCQEKEKN